MIFKVTEPKRIIIIHSFTFDEIGHFKEKVMNFLRNWFTLRLSRELHFCSNSRICKVIHGFQRITFIPDVSKLNAAL